MSMPVSRLVKRADCSKSAHSFKREQRGRYRTILGTRTSSIYGDLPPRANMKRAAAIQNAGGWNDGDTRETGERTRSRSASHCMLRDRKRSRRPKRGEVTVVKSAGVQVRGCRSVGRAVQDYYVG